MKLRLPLYLQVVFMLSLYLSTLASINLIFFNSRFGVGWEALLQSPAGERVDTVAEAIAAQLGASDQQNWQKILDSYGEKYQVEYYVFAPTGEEVAGKPVTLPPAVKQRVVMPFPTPGPTLSFPSMPPPSLSHHLIQPFSLPSPDDPLLGTQEARAFSSKDLFKKIPFPPHLRDAHGRFLVHSDNPDRFWIGTIVPLQSDQAWCPIPHVLVASSNNLWQSSLLLDIKLLTSVVGAVIVISIAFWGPFVYGITRNLSKLTKATEDIAEGKFGTTVHLDRNDEIGRLSEAINSMSQKLQAYVTGQKRFLGDISHELFSPIARMQMAVELLEDCSEKERKKLVKDIREEVDEMNALVSELLAYSKAELQGRTPELVPVNVKEIVEEVVRRLPSDSQVVIDLDSSTSVLGDRTFVQRALQNVLRNSIRYAAAEGPITVSARQQGGETSIVIADNGPGVPPDTLALLGQPLYRLEPSRDRSSGGVGLGLSIVKSCIEACHGKVRFRNRKEKGFEVELVLQSNLAKVPAV